MKPIGAVHTNSRTVSGIIILPRREHLIADAEKRISYLKIVTPKRLRSQPVDNSDTAHAISTKHYVYKSGTLQDGTGAIKQKIPLDQRDYSDAAARHTKLVSVMLSFAILFLRYNLKNNCILSATTSAFYGSRYDY